MREVIIYARVSTSMQEERESLDYQIKKCISYCELHDLSPVKIIKDVESGGNDEREGFLKLQREVKNNKYYALLVYETSRISRKNRTMYNFVHELDKAGINFISISQPGMDTITPQGRFFFSMQVTMDEYERLQGSARTKSNMYQRAKEGKWLGGTAALGYKNIDKKLVVDPEEAEIVKDIFHTYLEINSMNKISKKYHKSVASVRWILENPIYIGKKTYNKKIKNIATGKIKVNDTWELFEGEHDGIIEEDVFYRVQEMLRLNKEKFLYTRGSRVKLFSSLIECQCGGRYHSTTSTSRNKKRYFYYKCNTCKRKYNADALEEALISKIMFISDLELLNDNDDNLINEYIKKRDMLIKQEKYIEISKERLISIYTKGIISEEEFQKKYEDIKEQSVELEKNIQNIEEIISSEEKLSIKKDNVKLFREVMMELDIEDREGAKKIFRLMIERIIVNGDDLEDIEIFLRS